MADTESKIAAVVDSIALKAISRISLALVVPISVWGITKLAEMHDDVIKLQTQVVERSSDRYTGSDARRDGQNYLSLIARNQADIAVIAQRQLTDEKFLYQNVPVLINRH